MNRLPPVNMGEITAFVDKYTASPETVDRVLAHIDHYTKIEVRQHNYEFNTPPGRYQNSYVDRGKNGRNELIPVTKLKDSTIVYYESIGRTRTGEAISKLELKFSWGTDQYTDFDEFTILGGPLDPPLKVNRVSELYEFIKYIKFSA